MWQRAGAGTVAGVREIFDGDAPDPAALRRIG